jgi:hypothetical protein
MQKHVREPSGAFTGCRTAPPNGMIEEAKNEYRISNKEFRIMLLITDLGGQPVRIMDFRKRHLGLEPLPVIPAFF